MSASSGVPLFDQIRLQVRRQILAGDLAPGTALPSLRQLAADLEVSVITVKRAYEDLETEGLVVTQPGKGTTVAYGDTQFLGEKRLRLVEEALGKVIDQARQVGVEKQQFRELVELLWEDET